MMDSNTLRHGMDDLLRQQQAAEAAQVTDLLLPDNDDWVPDSTWLATIAILVEDAGWPGEEWVNDNSAVLLNLRREGWDVTELAQFAASGYESHKCGGGDAAEPPHDRCSVVLTSAGKLSFKLCTDRLMCSALGRSDDFLRRSATTAHLCVPAAPRRPGPLHLSPVAALAAAVGYTH